MATKREILEVIVFLETQYPKEVLPAATKAGYINLLADVPIEALQAAAEAHVKRSQWMPKVSELYQPAMQMIAAALGDRLTPEGAWLQLQDYLATKGETQLHPLAYRAYEFVGGWWAFRISDNPGMLRSQFINAFKAFAADAEIEANTPLSVKEAARRLSIQRAQEEAERLLLPPGQEKEGDA